MHVMSLMWSVCGGTRVRRLLTSTVRARRCLSSSAADVNNLYYSLCKQNGADPQYEFTQTSNDPPLFTARLIIPPVLTGRASDVSVVVEHQTSKVDGRRACGRLALDLINEHRNKLRSEFTAPHEIIVPLRESHQPLSQIHNANVTRLSSDPAAAMNAAETNLMRRVVKRFHAMTSYNILFRYEWDYIDGRSDLGKGDIVMADGNGRFAVIEVKVIFDVTSDGGSPRTIRTNRHKKRAYVKAQVRSSVIALKQLVPDYVQITGFTYTDDAMQGAGQKLEQCLQQNVQNQSQTQETQSQLQSTLS